MDIDAELERWQREREQIVTATVIAVRGSTPRAPGARLAFAASGRLVGSVSGGCVESEVSRRAREVFESGQPVIASFAVGEPDETGVGLSCGGGIDVLIERFADDQAWRAYRAAVSNAKAVVRVVAVAPARLMGRRMVVDATEAIGSVDPSMDARIVESAR